MRELLNEDKVSDLPPRQRGKNDRRRIRDEDESVLDSHEVSSIASLDRGLWNYYNKDGDTKETNYNLKTLFSRKCIFR